MVKNIVLLHGWTQTKEKLLSLKQELEKKGFQVFLPTLPGFGETRIKKPWQLDDYAVWLSKFLRTNKIEKTVLVGHSFGGQIAAKFSLLCSTKVALLVLISAAVIRKPPSFSRRALIKFSKMSGSLFKILPLSIFYENLRFLIYKLIREQDYYQSNPLLCQTMAQILSENLESQLSRLRLPTLILWGQEDKTTPVKNAFLIKRRLPRAKLVIFKGATHALPYNKPRRVAQEIIKFLKSGRKS